MSKTKDTEEKKAVEPIGQDVIDIMLNKHIKGRVPSVIKEHCKQFIVDNDLPFGKYGILLNLAIKSYKAMPIGLRDSWTLQEIVEQGL